MPRRSVDAHSRELSAYAEWEWYFAQVEAFWAERGHGELGEHPAGEWLRHQQKAGIAGRLSPDRQQRLVALGVRFEADDAAWENMLQSVRDYLMRHCVPRKAGRARWLPDPTAGELAAWLSEQRVMHEDGVLHPARMRRLHALMLLPHERAHSAVAASSRLTQAESRALRHAALWERRLRELAAYCREHGDCDVPKHWPENQPLANWTRFQRKARHLKRLSTERIARLDRLGFPWSTHAIGWDKLWERRFQEILQFKEQHGHTRVPKQFDKQLWHWRHVQREFRKKGMLKPERITRLDAISFEWEEDAVWGRTWDSPKEGRWDEMLRQLADYRARHGHVNVPHHGEANTKLGAWLNRQRMDARNGHLQPDRLARLEALGFVSAPGRPSLDKYWDQRYAELAAFHQEHGHTRVTSATDDPLSEWRYLQRASHRKGLLSAERIARLDALGFEWVGSEFSGLTQQQRWDLQWLAMYEQLVQFHREHGHCRVLANWEGNPRLADWVQDQRALRHQGKLHPGRLARLESVGFLWSVENIDHDARWERRFLQLRDYQRAHGHTRVPKAFDKQLWHWRHVQREFRRKGWLKPERAARLDAIGFEWVEHGKPWAKSREERWESQWDRMYAQLVEFQRQHGTTHVVAGWPENPTLSTWVGDQREREHHGGMRPDRKARLDAIGFLWNPGRPTLDAMWERRYAELVGFKEQHGHTRVPKGFDRQLWHWRHVQREFRKKGKLKAERIARLDAIGFEWEG